jgi:gas vesicle protein
VGQNPEELRRDIDRTRQELAGDVDALTEKVSPSRVVERRVERTKAGLSSVKDKVMGTASDATSATTDGVTSAGSAVGDTVSAAASGVAEGGTRVAEATRRKAEGNPLAAGVVAFGIGWLVSSLLPASEKERQAASKVTEVAKDIGQPLAEEAEKVTAEVKDNLAGPAQEAVESVKSTAQDAASTVKEEASSSASTVKEETTEAARAVREDGSSQVRPGDGDEIRPASTAPPSPGPYGYGA